ncbi:MAG TPA: hypothetical protein VHT34_05680 [Clostridia bacterium]|nr:hypothetical protein [Clostridia bacterium]
MIDPNVVNLAIGMLGSMGYDALKKGASVTAAWVKDKLRTWLEIDERGSNAIANAMNSAPDAYMTNQEIFTAFIKTNKDILQALSNARIINNNTINGGTFNGGIVNQGSSVQSQTINNYKVPEDLKKG